MLRDPTDPFQAIAEHQKLGDHLRALQGHHTHAVNENEMLRRELQNLRVENSQLRGEMGSTGGHAAPPPPAAQAQAPQPGSYHADPYASSSRTELPPLRSISNNLPSGSESMTGVQYEAPRSNGYRQERY